MSVCSYACAGGPLLDLCEASECLVSCLPSMLHEAAVLHQVYIFAGWRSCCVQCAFKCADCGKLHCAWALSMPFCTFCKAAPLHLQTVEVGAREL